MRTVQLYIGRDYIDLDCVIVTYTVDGVKWILELEKNGEAYGRNTYYFTNTILTINLFFTVDDYWNIEIDTGTEFFAYYSPDTTLYPVINDWDSIGGGLEFIETTECSKLKYERIELFDDEKISVTSSVQNLADISKTFTDFSQSFTIPASVVNNRIFEHFYQNDVDGTIDHNLKRPAYIEIDYVPFRNGVIGLEKSQVKNGLAYSYTISFYGNLTSLTNIFGDVKLNQLDFSPYEFPYTGTAVYDRVRDNTVDYDVRYPLIASDRLWSYGNLGAEDITQNSHAIQYTELFPAIKVQRIFNAIQSYFKINFYSSFFTNDRFDKLFLYCKNTIKHEFITESLNLDFLTKTNVYPIDWFTYVQHTPYEYVDLVNNKIIISQFDNDIQQQAIQVNITSKSVAGKFYVDVYRNGIYNQTFQGTTTGVVGTVNINNLQSNGDYTFSVKADVPMTLGIQLTYGVSVTTTDIYGNPITLNASSVITTTSNVLNGYVNVGQTMPDMKVSDFVAGIIKEFNATCVGIDQKNFQILPLENWYSLGATFDITTFVDINEIEISRIPLYNTIEFKYQQSESFVNKNYFKTSNSEYGNAYNTFSYDGGNFTIDSPFENLLFARSVDQFGNEALLGYNLNETYQAYVPKPTLLYMFGQSPSLSAHSIKFNDGSSNINLNNYMLFGQDITVGGTKYSLNFGADNSIIHLETIQNGLFATYYFTYLTNLYNLKQRLTTVKTILPTSLITSIQLNDRLIIRDKRYIINDIKLDLTSGEATLTLYNDFRDVLNSDIIEVDSEGEERDMPISYRPNVTNAILDGLGEITFDPDTVNWAENDYSNKVTTMTVPANPYDYDRYLQFKITYSDTTVLNYTVFQTATKL